jgi:hypothetical protein
MNQERQVIYVVLVMMLLVIAGKCAVSKPHSNSLGIPMYNTNPLMYTAGSLANTADSVSNVDGNLNLRIKPLGTYMLYDEQILFCGLPMEKFQGIIEPFVLVYERQAHRTVQGVGCHELVRVNSLKEAAR